MKKNFIVVVLVLLVSIFGIKGFLDFVLEENMLISNKTVEIDVLDDVINVRDNYKLNGKYKGKIEFSKLFRNNNATYSRINVNGVDLENINDENLKIPFINGKEDICLEYSFSKNESNSVVKKYVNDIVLQLPIEGNLTYKVEDYDVIINFLNNTDFFEVDNKLNSSNVSKIGEKSYKIHVVKKQVENEQFLNILFNKNASNIAKVEEGNYKSDVKKSIFFAYLIFSINYLIIIIAFIVYFFKRDKKIKTDKVRRETTDLLNPVLSEYIIDDKLGIKETLMTIISDLIVRKKIEVINNEAIKLIDSSELKEYEELTLSIFFDSKDVFYFKELKTIFVENDKKTKEIYDKINNIKRGIVLELDKENLLDRNKENIMQFIRNSIVSIEFVKILYLFIEVEGFKWNWSVIVCGFVLWIFILGLYISKHNQMRNAIKEESNNNSKLIIYAIFFVLTMYMLMDKYYLQRYSLILLSLFILDFVFLFFTKKFFLSDKGKQEKEKLLELKNYINEYSIIEKRDLEEIILWDDYLVYAIAFGIPNKVTNKIYYSYLKLNIWLQYIRKNL